MAPAESPGAWNHLYAVSLWMYKLVTLNDLERRNEPHFALFHQIL